jgi:hypothetical protein
LGPVRTPNTNFSAGEGSLKKDKTAIDSKYTHFAGKYISVKTCGKAENDEAKSGNDEAKGVPGRRGVTEGDGR